MSASAKVLKPGDLVCIVACTAHNHDGEPCPHIGAMAIAIDDIGDAREDGRHHYDFFIVGEWGRKWFPLDDVRIQRVQPWQLQ